MLIVLEGFNCSFTYNKINDSLALLQRRERVILPSPGNITKSSIDGVVHSRLVGVECFASVVEYY